MGKFATSIQDYLCESLTEQQSGRWETEYNICGTPVDIGGQIGSQLYLIELEWRRADPADNAAKIFRHLSRGDVNSEEITVFQIFTDYYKLSRGGVSSKRKNAEFVGGVAAQTFDRLSYVPIDFDINPPKRGEDWPDNWQETTEKTVTTLCEKIGMNGTC